MRENSIIVFVATELKELIVVWKNSGYTWIEKK